MKRVGLLILAMVPLLMDCGAPAPAPDPMNDPARLEVNDRLRAACIPFLQDDQEIESSITVVEVDRLNGFSYTVEIQATMSGCGSVSDPSVAVDCATCGTAIVNQVYGR